MRTSARRTRPPRFGSKRSDDGEREAERAGADVMFRQYDALTPPPGDLVGRFDLGITISCLAMACGDAQVFERALGHLVSLVRPGGRFFFLEPIHESRLLRRILKMGTREWIARSERQGLELVARGRMGFVPARLLLAFRDWPDACVRPLFAGGEWLLDH